MTPSDPWVNIWNPDDEYAGTPLATSFERVSRSGEDPDTTAKETGR